MVLFSSRIPIFSKKNLQTHCMDVRARPSIAGTLNFKTVFQNASKHVIFIQKIEKKILGGDN